MLTRTIEENYASSKTLYNTICKYRSDPPNYETWVLGNWYWMRQIEGSSPEDEFFIPLTATRTGRESRVGLDYTRHPIPILTLLAWKTDLGNKNELRKELLNVPTATKSTHVGAPHVQTVFDFSIDTLISRLKSMGAEALYPYHRVEAVYAALSEASGSFTSPQLCKIIAELYDFPEAWWRATKLKSDKGITRIQYFNLQTVLLRPDYYEYPGEFYEDAFGLFGTWINTRHVGYEKYFMGQDSYWDFEKVSRKGYFYKKSLSRNKRPDGD